MDPPRDDDAGWHDPSMQGYRMSSDDAADEFDAPLPAAPTAPRQASAPPTFDGSCGVLCARCGYDLTGVSLGANCPECGMAVTASFQAMRKTTSGSAITSLVLGIVSIPLCSCAGVPSVVCGILAIYFYYRARIDLQRGVAGGSSQGLAVAGLTTGIIGLALGLLYCGFVAFSILIA